MVHRITKSYLAESALLDYADGLKSSIGVARTCVAGRRDGITIPMLEKLASIGDRNMVHCSDRLHKILSDSGAYDHVTDTDADGYTYCILSTEVVKLVARNPRAFGMHFAPNKEVCRRFWREFLSTDEGQDYKARHPVLKDLTLEELATFIPLRIHEDSGPYSKNGSVSVLSWSSLLARGTEKETRYVHLVCPLKISKLLVVHVCEMISLNFMCMMPCVLFEIKYL